MYHYCSQCGNTMKEYNVYGQRTLNCQNCGQQIAYGHRDHRKDKETPRYQEEARQEDKEENIVECKVCAGAWLEKDLIPESVTIYGAFFRCPHCGNRIFVRF